jgi:hypothetical protein
MIAALKPITALSFGNNSLGLRHWRSGLVFKNSNKPAAIGTWELSNWISG